MATILWLMFEMHGFQSVYAFLTGKEAAGTTVKSESRNSFHCVIVRMMAVRHASTIIIDLPNERSNASGELELAAKVSESDCVAACQALSKQML